MAYEEKLYFLKNTFPSLVSKADPSTPPVFGKMNLQQMVEHMSDSVRDAYGITNRPLVTPEEKVPAMKAFVMSDREFKPNTKNSLMGEDPDPLRKSSLSDALDEYNAELQNFINHFHGREHIEVVNPFFGPLNYEGWIQLLHKHAVHHCRQFLLVNSD